jgi:uncharacterized peroxidase-related enzyme
MGVVRGFDFGETDVAVNSEQGIFARSCFYLVMPVHLRQQSVCKRNNVSARFEVFILMLVEPVAVIVFGKPFQKIHRLLSYAGWVHCFKRWCVAAGYRPAAEFSGYAVDLTMFIIFIGKNNRMPNIALPEEYPGIRSLFMYSPVTALPLNQLVQTLLHDEASSTLTPGERELIATYTSSLNECVYCANTHGAIARYQLGDKPEIVAQVRANPDHAAISDKMKALLKIAAKVQRDGRSVTPDDIAQAKHQGATEREVHDTVLITAAFCMFNRYVDGLGTWSPTDPAIYDAIGKQRASEGYMTTPFKVKR